MQFRDLKRQYEALKPQMDRAMAEAVADAHFIMGPQVKALESELAEYVGVKRCISCANGTDALDIALKVWGIGPGDAVFVPDFTFFSSAEVVALEGATPVFVDVLESTFNMDPDDLERAIGEVVAEGRLRPRVIVAVDLFGLPADFARIRAIADKHGLLILEDGAQGFGGSIAATAGQAGSVRRACSFGDISTTSFFPAKPLGCYGDGGAIFTDNEEWAALADSYRVHGKGSMKYDNVRVGLNSRLDTLQAAVLQVKLQAFRDCELDRVNEVARWYGEAFRRVGLDSVIALPRIPSGHVSSWAQYTVRIPAGKGQDGSRRDAVQQALKAQGVPAMVYYVKPMSAQKAFTDAETCRTSAAAHRTCPTARRLCTEVLSLPMHPYMTHEEVETVVAAIANALRGADLAE